MSLLRREMINVIFKHIIKFSSTSTKPLEYVVYIGISESGSEFATFHILYHKQKLDFAISTLQNRGFVHRDAF